MCKKLKVTLLNDDGTVKEIDTEKLLAERTDKEVQRDALRHVEYEIKCKLSELDLEISKEKHPQAKEYVGKYYKDKDNDTWLYKIIDVKYGYAYELLYNQIIFDENGTIKVYTGPIAYDAEPIGMDLGYIQRNLEEITKKEFNKLVKKQVKISTEKMLNI